MLYTSVHVKLVNFNHQVDKVKPFADFVRIIRTAIGVYNSIDAAPIRYPSASAIDLSASSSMDTKNDAESEGDKDSVVNLP